MNAHVTAPLVSLAAVLMLAVPASASAPAGFTALDACRTGPHNVTFNYLFEGGACQQVGEPVVSAPERGMVTVTMPSTESSDVCTMQIVPIEGTAVLGLDESRVGTGGHGALSRRAGDGVRHG